MSRLNDRPPPKQDQTAEQLDQGYSPDGDKDVDRSSRGPPGNGCGMAEQEQGLLDGEKDMNQPGRGLPGA